MSAVNWCNVVYVESDQKLILTEQDFYQLPDAILNLYHSRVRVLDLSYNRLTSLEGISLFPTLEELILDNNHLSDNLRLPRNTNLRILSLNNNKINDVYLAIARLSINCPNIQYLSLLGNPGYPDELSSNNRGEADYQHHRDNIIYSLPKLKFLDFRSISQYEYRKALNTAHIALPSPNSSFKYNAKLFMEKLVSKRDSKVYSPLPEIVRQPGDHRGAYGRRSYKYVGAQSEGNRFIVNNDL